MLVSQGGIRGPGNKYRANRKSLLRRAGRRPTQADSRGSPIAIMRLEQLARTPVADCRLCLRFGASLRRPSPALESDKYLRSRLDPGQIDLWAVSVCTRGDRRNISDRVQSTSLLGREVQEEEGRRRSRAASGVR